jgi:ABC-type dipeptide/oligopeptide/nickel transport system permease component
MTTYIIRRTLIAVPVMIAISIGIFFLVRLAPGDPVTMRLDPELAANDPGYIERRRAELGLDQPVPVQYLNWARLTAQGDLGFSFMQRRPVLDVVLERIPATLRLMGTAIVIALILAVPLGIIAALRRNSPVDYSVAALSLTAISVPSFFLALGSIYVFGLVLGLLPTSGMGDGGFRETWRYLVMPAGILGFALAGPMTRYVRSSLLEELGKDYVRTARAKGSSPTRVVVRHALRNSLIPLITVIAIYIPQMLAGAVVLEQIFAWPGMGRLVISAINNRDYPVIVGFTLFVGFLVVLFNLIADILYAVVDPRISLR